MLRYLSVLVCRIACPSAAVAKTVGRPYSQYFLLVLAVSLTSGRVAAEPIQAGQTSWLARAIQDVTLFANTPINPTNDAMFIDDLFGVATAAINRETQLGDTIEIPTLTGWDFVGSLPGIGDYRFGAVGPFTGSDYSGTISNVVQDPNDPGFASGAPSSLVSGDFMLTGDSFAFEFLSGPLAGVILTTDPSQDFAFTMQLDGLPPSNGTTLTNAGDEFLNIMFDGQIIGTSSDRRIITIPEPHALAIGSWIGWCLVACARRR